jgi:hypothetical protein
VGGEIKNNQLTGTLIFKLTEQSLEKLKSEEVPDDVIGKLKTIIIQRFTDKKKFLKALESAIGDKQTFDKYKAPILKHTAGRMSVPLLETSNNDLRSCSPTRACNGWLNRAAPTRWPDMEFK